MIMPKGNVWPAVHPDPKKQSRHLRFWTPYDRRYRHFDLRPAIILEVGCRYTVNPVPRTYVRDFRACLSARSRTFTPYSPRSNSTAVLERGSRIGRSVVRGKSSTLARPDAHQGVFHERNNLGSGLIVIKAVSSTRLKRFIGEYPWSELRSEPSGSS